MLKKIMLSALCIFAAASVIAAPRIRVDQSSKEAVVETFIRAIGYDDVDGFWAILDPEFRSAAAAEVGGEAQAKKVFWTEFRKSCPSSQNATFRQILNNAEQKREAVNTMISQNPNWFVRKNGKWYINPLK